MKPKPFDSLKNFTVPVLIIILLLLKHIPPSGWERFDNMSGEALSKELFSFYLLFRKKSFPAVKEHSPLTLINLYHNQVDPLFKQMLT